MPGGIAERCRLFGCAARPWAMGHPAHAKTISVLPCGCGGGGGERVMGGG